LKNKVLRCLYGCAFGILASAGSAEAEDLIGTAKDKSGAGLSGAKVIVLTAQRAVVATTQTDQSGKFSVPGLADGQYLVVVQYPGLTDRQATATVTNTNATVALVLDIAAVGEDVTVTANPGGLGDIARLTQPINKISEDQILIRARTVVAQAVEGEPGVALQRTSPGMAGIFVRGLTGNKVNIFVDGVRYSNGAQRGGVNTFLDLIDPSAIEGIEILRGPSSAQYGSDALGGSVQFLSRVPTLSTTGKPAVSGNVMFGGEVGGHPGGVGGAVMNFGAKNFGLLGTFSARKSGDYQPGGGNDSHAAVTRYLGLDSNDFYGDSMFETGFKQNALQLRANYVASNNFLVVGNYVRSRQDDANRWDQTLGGDGNLIAELNDLQLDLAYLRVEWLKAGWFDHASGTYSFNTQREERVNQGGNGSNTASIAHEPERTSVNGWQFNLQKQINPKHSLLVGGDAYYEKLESVATDVNPVTLVVSPRRPRVPDQATNHQGGLFAQLTIDAVPDKLSVVAAARFGFTSYAAHQSDAPVVNGRPLWPDDSFSSKSGTFRLGAAFRATNELTFSTAVSSGYRAPHMTDLGTLGLTGSGFEVAFPDVEGLNGTVGSTADASAVSTGAPVQQLEPETSVNFDFGARYRHARVRTEFNAFVNNIDGNIQKQALILPQGAVGTLLGTTPITQQNANGAVFVSLTTVPVLVRANFDEARVWGIEWVGEFDVAKEATLGASYTYLHSRDQTTHLPPNIEGGTPAPTGDIWLRYAKSGQKWWVQPYFRWAAEQSNLSTLDLGDRRTGATRSRGNIQNFFRNGARNRGWVNSGADGIPNNADDILIATGETLAQVQDRVLGVGVNSAPMLTAVKAYQLFGVRFGLTWEKHSVQIDASNLGDENYRGISWGMDGPGRMITARYAFRY